jgi:amino acid permease
MKFASFSSGLFVVVVGVTLTLLHQQTEAIQLPQKSNVVLPEDSRANVVPRGGKVILGKNPEVPRQTTTGGGASVTKMIFNLVKSIVGAGVLGLPAGIAAFGSSGQALIPSFVLILSIGVLSSYGFSLIGRVCAYTEARSYREAWEKSVSTTSGWVPAAACFLVTLGSVLAYSMILSDTIPQLVKAFTGFAITRTQALLSLTSFVLLPLCLMKDLSSLAPFSLLGIAGMTWVTISMTIRFFDGTYSVGGKFYEQLSPQFVPSFEKVGILDMVSNPNIFLLISMLATSFMAHYSA